MAGEIAGKKLGLRVRRQWRVLDGGRQWLGAAEPTWEELSVDVGRSGPDDCGMAEAAAGAGRQVGVMGV